MDCSYGGGIPQNTGSIDNYIDASGVIANSVISQEVGPDGGGIINMPPFAQEPADSAMRDNDIYLSSSGVNPELKARIGGTVYSVELV